MSSDNHGKEELTLGIGESIVFLQGLDAVYLSPAQVTVRVDAHA